MYESFFNFTERPFPTTPQLQGYFPSEQIENALQSIVSCVERGAGPALVIASTGTGKTTLVLKLQEHFASTIPVAVLCGTNCRSPRSLLQNALFSVGLPYVDMDEGQMRLSLTEFFKSRAAKGSNTLLIMDDADSLSTDLLEELLGFSSLTGQNGWCVPMVLIGSFRLEEALGSPRVASLNQRIAARCYIDAWSRSEVDAYIHSRMEQTRTETETIFLPGSAAKISEVTGGIPRVVNQLCDHALVMAAQREQRQIDEFSIEEAWSDLQRLPLPVNHFTAEATTDTAADETNDPASPTDADSIVEFGSLDDEPGDIVDFDSNEANASDAAFDATYDLEKDATHHVEENATDNPTSETTESTLGATSFAAAAIGGLATGHLLSPSEQESPLPADDPSRIEPTYPEKAEAMELQRAIPSERSESPSLTPPIAERDPGFLIPPSTPDLAPAPIEPLESLPFDAPNEEATGHAAEENTTEEESAISEEASLDGTSENLLGQPLDPLESTSQNPLGYEPIQELPAFTPQSEEATEYELTPVEQTVPLTDLGFDSELPEGETAEADATDFEPLDQSVVPNDQAPLPASELPPIPPPSSLHAPSEPSNDFNVNPFMEEFDEEEVVLERVVGMSAASSRVTQAVETEEGQVLTDVLQIMEQQRASLHAEPQLPMQPMQPMEEVEETPEQETMLEIEATTEHEEEVFVEQEPADENPVQTPVADADEHRFEDEDAFDNDAIVEVGLTPPPMPNDATAFDTIENNVDATSAVGSSTDALPMGFPLEMQKNIEAEETNDPLPLAHDTGFGDFDDAFNKAIEANDMPTPGLHNPGFDQGAEFTTMDMPIPDYDLPPMGIPRGQVTSEDSLLDHEGEAGQFDDLFSRLQEDA